MSDPTNGTGARAGQSVKHRPQLLGIGIAVGNGISAAIGAADGDLCT